MLESSVKTINLMLLMGSMIRKVSNNEQEASSYGLCDSASWLLAIV